MSTEVARRSNGTRGTQPGAITVVQMTRRPRPTDFSIERLFRDIRPLMPGGIEIEVFTCRNLSKGLWARVEDMLVARKCQADINHVTGDVHYLTFLLDRKRTILTIHDLTQLTRLKGVKRWIYWAFWFWLPVKRSAAIAVISLETKRQFLRHVPCDPDIVHVVHNPVSPDFTPQPYRFNVTRPRILQIGTHWNKNLERVIEALSGVTCRLVIVGPLSGRQVELLERRQVDYENHVGLSDDDIVAQYTGCDALVFVSVQEGFGLPILEANATGRPVITSNLSAMPEVAGDSACFVDPYDVTEIRLGVRRVLEDEEYRNDLIRRGFNNIKRFRVDVTARAYADLYEKIYSDLDCRRASGPRTA